MVTELIDEKAAFPELASHQSVHEMCDSSAPTHEMYDPSFPTEMPMWASARRRDSPDILDPINSESGRRSLWHRRRGTPAMDPRCSSAKKSSNGLPDTNESGNTNSFIAREASKTDGICRGPILGINPTPFANSTLHRQSDGNKYEIRVSTDMSREISDSSSTSPQSPCVETRISSSAKHKSVDLNRPLPILPQRNSLNSPPPFPSIPKSNNAHLSPIKNTSSNRSSVVNCVRKLSNRASVSYSDYETVECVPIVTLPDVFGTPHDTSWKTQTQREPSIMRSSSTDIEMGDESLPANASSEDPTRSEDLRNHCPIWNSVSSSILTPTADYPDSNIVSPSSPNSGFSSPLSTMFSPISPIAECVSQPSRLVFPVAVSGEGLDLGTAKHQENAAGGWVLSSPPPLELKPKEPEHSCSALNAFEPRLPIQRPVSDITIASASGAQWTKDNMPSGHFHPSHRRFRSEGWHAPSVSTQSRQVRTQSSSFASLMHPRGIDELLESEASSSILNPTMTKVDASSPWSPVFLPSVSSSALPALDIHMDSSIMDGSTSSLQAELAVSPFGPVDINAGDHDLSKLTSSIGEKDQLFPFSSPYSSARWPGIVSLDDRQMHVPPLFSSRRDIFSPDDKSDGAGSHPRRLRASPRSLTLSRALSQSPTQEGQASGVSSEIDVTSARQCRPDLPSALHSPSAMKTMPHCFDRVPLLVTHSSSKQTQVEELEALVGIVNDHWMQKLRSVPELRLRCSALSVRVVFEKGIWTLREIFRGSYVQTFEDAFALIHLAFASAFLLHCQQDSYSLDAFNDDAFYDDALQWQQALSDKEDKILFLKAMDCWLWIPEPELQPNPLLNSSHHKSFGSITSIHWRESFSCSNQADPMEVLSTSEIFKPCIGFLDGESIFSSFKLAIIILTEL